MTNKEVNLGPGYIKKEYALLIYIYCTTDIVPIQSCVKIAELIR